MSYTKAVYDTAYTSINGSAIERFYEYNNNVVFSRIVAKFDTEKEAIENFCRKDGNGNLLYWKPVERLTTPKTIPWWR